MQQGEWILVISLHGILERKNWFRYYFHIIIIYQCPGLFLR
jgi:hypothetical protein